MATYQLPTPKKLGPSFKIKQPKNRVLADATEKIGKGLDILNSGAVNHLTKPMARRAIRDALGCALDALFKRKLLVARSYLASASDILLRANNKHLPIQKPTHIPATALKDVNFIDEDTGRDLCDLITVCFTFEGERICIEGSRALGAIVRPTSKIKAELNHYLTLISEMMEALEDRNVLKADLQAVKEDWLGYNDVYLSVPNAVKGRKLHAQWRQQLELPASTSNKDAYRLLSEGLKSNITLFENHLTELNFLAANTAWKECEEQLRTFKGFVGYMVHLGQIHLAQQASQDASRATQSTQKLENEDIWELVADCGLEGLGALRSEWDESMDKWWGAYKYFVLGGCAFLLVLTLVALAAIAPIAILSALFDFVYCFVTGMLGGTFGIAWTFAQGVRDCIYPGHA